MKDLNVKILKTVGFVFLTLMILSLSNNSTAMIHQKQMVLMRKRKVLVRQSEVIKSSQMQSLFSTFFTKIAFLTGSKDRLTVLFVDQISQKTLET